MAELLHFDAVYCLRNIFIYMVVKNRTLSMHAWYVEISFSPVDTIDKNKFLS